MEIRNLGQENRGSFGVMTKYCVDGKMDCSIFFAKGMLGQCTTITHFRPCEKNHEDGELVSSFRLTRHMEKSFKEMLDKVGKLSEEEKNKYINTSYRS